MSRSPAAQAQWTGKAELGFLQSTGNTEAASANTKLDMKRETEKWIHNYALAALYSEPFFSHLNTLLHNQK